MILSFNWLNQYVKHSLTAEQVAHELTFRACPVESIEKLPDGDVRIGLEVTFNRNDLNSHVGVAREVACAAGGKVELPPVALAEDAACPVEKCASVEVEATDLCPRYTARVLRGVTVKESPAWLKARLEAIGVRPVNNVVDVTNFVLFETGQPLHAFDLATLNDRKIVVRRARKGEAITAIDGKKYELGEGALVIADAKRPVAVAGVMGGLETEISDRTRDVLLESAYFDPVATRRAVRQLGLRSDSSYRFERGVDPAGVAAASARAAQLLLEVAGGTLCAGLIDADAGTLPGPRKLSLRLSRLRQVTGADISRREAARLLSLLGFDVIETDLTLEVTVPTSRLEVEREIDLIEEVLRTYGYDKVALTPSFPIRVAPVAPRERAIDRAKALMVGAGFREILTLSFVERDEAIDPPVFGGADAAHTVKNPVQPETPALRRSLFGSLLHAKRINAEKGNRRVKLFEVATAYLPRAGDQPREQLELGWVADQGFLEGKGVLEALFAGLGLGGRMKLGAAGGAGAPALAGMDPLQQADVLLDGARVGVFGKVALPAGALSPRAKALYEGVRPAGKGVEWPTVAIVDLDALVEAAEKGGTLLRRATPLPEFPAVVRDLAVVVEKDRYWQEIADVVAGAAKGIEHLQRFDYIQGSVFEGGEGKPVPAGKKSVAISLEFRAAGRTLTGEEADRGREAVKAALQEKLGAAFRE